MTQSEMIHLFADIIDENGLIDDPDLYFVMLGFGITGLLEKFGLKKGQYIIENTLKEAIAKEIARGLVDLVPDDLGKVH